MYTQLSFLSLPFFSLPSTSSPPPPSPSLLSFPLHPSTFHFCSSSPISSPFLPSPPPIFSSISQARFPDGRCLLFSPRSSEVRWVGEGEKKLDTDIVVSHGVWTGNTTKHGLLVCFTAFCEDRDDPLSPSLLHTHTHTHRPLSGGTLCSDAISDRHS